MSLYDPFSLLVYRKLAKCIVIKVTTVPPKVISEAVWFDDVKMLEFVIAKTMPNTNMIIITISKQAGITSASNVARNSPTHRISAIMSSCSYSYGCGFGHIPDTAMDESSLIRAYGAVVQSKLSFDPPSTPDQPNPHKVTLYIQFAVDLDLVAGDHVDIILPGFTLPVAPGDAAQHISVTSEPVKCFANPSRCEGHFGEGFWIESETRLSLRVQREMPAHHNTTVRIGLSLIHI